MSDNLQSIMAMIREGLAAGGKPQMIQKAAGITVATGLVNYDLQRPALATYPFLESMRPIANSLARVPGNGDTATRWKAITGINTTNVPIGVAEGQRNAAITTTLVDRLRSYQGIGLEDFVTFEARYAAMGYDDAYARGVQSTLRAAMLAEEPMILGGNVSIALGTTPTPTATGAATGGALSDGTYYVGCVALTPAGYANATVSATGVVQTISRTNMDATVDTINGGVAQKSANSSGVVLNAGTAVQRVSANVTAVRGAVAYAWYLGTTGASTMYLQQITTINSVNFSTALVTSTQNFAALTSADYSRQTGFAFDGVLYQTGFDSASGAYYTALATGTDGTGTKLTSDGSAGITQINTALRAFWDTYRTGPNEIWASATHVLDMTALVIANGGAPLMRFNLPGGKEATGNQIAGGNAIMSGYLNKLTGQMLSVKIHPNLPDGTILFRTTQSPFAYSGVGNVDEIHLRQDWYQIEWPLKTRRQEFGVYADETYVNYMPFLCGIIHNVATGT